MAYLVLVRHGTSVWNALGQWTGLTDVDLAPEGVEEARKAGKAIKDIHVDVAYVSALKRTRQTFDAMRDAIGRNDLEPIASAALN